MAAREPAGLRRRGRGVTRGAQVCPHPPLDAASAAPPIISGFTPSRSATAPDGSIAAARPINWAVTACTASASDTLNALAMLGSAGMIMPCPRLISIEGR